MNFIKKYGLFESDEFDFSGPGAGEKYHKHLKRFKEDEEYKKRWFEYRDAQIIKYWSELKPFRKSTDVPDLPKPLTEFFISRLIELGAIPKSELKDGHWYYGDYRNTKFGRWNQEKNVFDHIRYSFGSYWDTCNHFEDDDGFALFTPLREVTEEEREEIKRAEDEISKRL